MPYIIKDKIYEIDIPKTINSPLSKINLSFSLILRNKKKPFLNTLSIDKKKKKSNNLFKMSTPIFLLF